MEDNKMGKLSVIVQFMNFMFKDFKRDMAAKGLNKSETSALMMIDYMKENYMSEISEMTGLEKSSFTALANRLIRKELVVKVRSDVDKRKVKLQITEKGSLITEEINKNLTACIEGKLSVLNKDERQDFDGVLKKISYYTEVLKSRLED